MNMSMTHYMELLVNNQPWNLILFMAVPVILAEFITIVELYVLYSRRLHSRWHRASRVTGMFAGVYFLGVFAYLMTNAVVPITAAGEWRGLSDMIAVGAYLLGVIPLAGIALIDSRLVLRTSTEDVRLNSHVLMFAVLLVVAHVAMILRMLTPIMRH